jgi:hypothetical protein
MVSRRSLKAVVALGLLFALGVGLSATIGGEGIVHRVAGAEDLAQYPNAALEEGNLAGGSQYAALLPESDLVVVLRPITREEYGSYQVRAVSYEVIEREMLAAAIVLPVLGVGDVAGLPPALVSFLRSQVNVLSGFDVFPDVLGSGQRG